MNTQSILFLLPYVFSVFISLGVFYYTWRRREVSGAVAFSWFILSVIFYTLFYALELVNDKIETKLFWGNLRFVLTVLGPLSFLNFVIAFTRRKLIHPVRTWTLLLGVALLLISILYTDRYHQLFYPEGSLAVDGPYTALNYEYTPIAWMLILYGYGVGLFSLMSLISSFSNARKLFHPQIFTIVLGTTAPLIGTVLASFRVKIFSIIDPTYISSAVGSIIIAMGLFRFRLFEIVPVARENLIEKMQDIVIVLDLHNRFVDANPAALSVLGLRENKVIGRSAADVIPNWDSLEKQYNESPGNPIELVIGDGEESRDLSAIFTDLLDGKSLVVGQLVIARDITEQKRAERKIKENNEKLERLNKELLRLDQIKDDFVANISHELRSPMTNIRLIHELIILQPKRVSEFMETLTRETVRLADLIESLLALSRFDRGIFKLDKSTFDLSVLVAEYVQDQSALAIHRELSLSLIGEPVNLSVCADRNQIGRVLSNILTNALNYTPEGGQISILLQNRKIGNDEWVGFTVQDSGLGITLDDQEHLFTRFFRGNVGSKSGYSGTGLGLAISKEIIEHHGGEIIVESRGIPGDGTTFTVWLPRDDC